jgi:uncharacterized coiled-coil protein SlyX
MRAGKFIPRKAMECLESGSTKNSNGVLDMSPLTEKLAAILDDWDQLTSALTEIQRQCAAKDGTIAGLQQTVASQQQQLTRQASEVTSLKNQLANLQQQAMAALLTAADPEDAKLKQRIEQAYAAMETKTIPASPSSSGSGMPSPQRPATPTTFSESGSIGQSERPATPGPIKVSPTPTSGSRVLSIPVHPIRTTTAKPQPQPVANSK